MPPRFRSPVLWIGIVTVAILPFSLRAALPVALACSIAWLNARDRAGTFVTLYVVLLVILAVLALLIAGLGLIHRLISG